MWFLTQLDWRILHRGRTVRRLALRGEPSRQRPSLRLLLLHDETVVRRLDGVALRKSDAEEFREEKNTLADAAMAQEKKRLSPPPPTFVCKSRARCAGARMRTSLGETASFRVGGDVLKGAKRTCLHYTLHQDWRQGTRSRLIIHRGLTIPLWCLATLCFGRVWYRGRIKIECNHIALVCFLPRAFPLLRS